MRQHRKPPYDFRDKAKFLKVTGDDILQYIVLVQALFSFGGAVTYGLHIQALGYNAFYAVEGAAGYKKDIFRIDFNKFLVWVFPATFRGDINHGTFQQFQQALLYTFPGNIAGYGRIVAFPGNFIQFINKNNATFGFFHIVVCGLEQSGKDAFNILAHITGLCKYGGVHYGQGYIEHPGYCFGY